MMRLARSFALALALCSVLATVAGAQEYRGRVQGSVFDESQGALPGATVTLLNDATGVSSSRVTEVDGRYLFDFVEPGTYTITAELDGFKKAEQKNVRMSQRGDVTADLTLSVGGLEETVTVEAPPVAVQFNSASSDLTMERQLVDQTPLPGRNPYGLASLDPSIAPIVATATNENKPYHHASANEFDSGGGTFRANDVLLDGVPLNASYKASYTPSVDAVEEITVSKNSVDAENGNSLGGIISLNMKSGTNNFKGSGYAYFRDPSMNARTDATLVLVPGIEPIRGSTLRMFGGTLGGPIMRNKIFSFTSFEQWDDTRPTSVVRTVPTEAERRGDFSQSLLGNTVRTIYNPFTSTVGPGNTVVRTPFAGNVIPSNLFDPVALKMLQQIPLPNVPGYVNNLQIATEEKVDYWNFSQRVDINFSDTVKMFARYGQFKADVFQDNPVASGGGFFPLTGSNRDGLSVAADVVWIMSNKTTLNVRGSFYNMVDEFFNPSLLLGADGLTDYWSNAWYSSLYNSGYVYYPALDVTSGTGTGTGNRLGRQGREWYQRPDAWNVSARMNRYQGAHNMKWGGEVRRYYGEAARFEPINLVFNSTLTANSSDSPQVATTGNQWASFLLGALDGQSSARLVPLQTPTQWGFSSYFQDDWRLNDRLTLNLGLRWEYEPGPTDKDNRMSRYLDLTQAIPEMQATPPNMPSQAATLMASKGYNWIYNGAWQFTNDENPNVWETSWKDVMPRVGVNYRLTDDSVLRFAYARFKMPLSAVRETLGAFVDQYTGFAQTTTTLGLLGGRPQQTLADPFPSNNPVIEPYGQTLGAYTGLGGAVNFDQYELRPQLNDRVNVSYQKQIWGGMIFEAGYFFNWGSRVSYTKNLNMMDPAFTYEYGTALNATVPNPFRNYLTPDKFPGSLRNNSTVTLRSLLVPYPQYGTINQTNTTDGRNAKTHSVDLRVQRPFTNGLSFLLAYAFVRDRVENWLDAADQYEVFQTNGEEGWEWQPNVTRPTPEHRMTTAVTWLIPVGKNQRFLADMPTALDFFVGGWQYSATGRLYSGIPVLFTNAVVVNGNPKLDSPERDQWFDTSKFSAQPSNSPRTNPVYFDGLNGPRSWFVDMTLTKSFPLGSRYKIEARIEAYNAFNNIVWGQPNTTFGSGTFGQVTTKANAGLGREIQVGLRFVF